MQQGFSLVELSIVLVILGLLTGGILSGQSLIRAAELRSVATEVRQYSTAIHSFRDKYFALPGDFKDATKFWGKDNTNCSSHTGTTATPGTCNGDGDGVLEAGGGAGLTTEYFQVWKQLALAGLIEGNYSGLSGSGGSTHCVVGTDCPASRLPRGGWAIATESLHAGNSQQYARYYKNYLRIGAQWPNSQPGGAVLRPEEAWNIDTKIDDGRPAYGNVIAMFWNNACAAADDGTHANNDLNASYKLSDTDIQCSLIFEGVF